MATEHPDIFRALAAPFPKEQERTRNQGGMTLTYITARAVMNRLDEVIGPENWWPRYEETKDGIKCAITLRLPDGREITKEDGGGFATAMKAEDDVEKSGFSDALKRAGVAWGIGRYLYRDGVPGYTAAQPKTAAATSPGPIAGTPGKPPKPAPPGIGYRKWLEQFCENVNEKWAGCLIARSEPPKDLVTIFQVNRHLLKTLTIAAPVKDEKTNLKASEDAWPSRHQAMDVEATEYCRREWMKAMDALKAKLRAKREPGTDDNMPSPDEDAALDRMVAGKAGANA